MITAQCWEDPGGDGGEGGEGGEGGDGPVFWPHVSFGLDVGVVEMLDKTHLQKTKVQECDH
jgi:hypothetical protein